MVLHIQIYLSNERRTSKAYIAETEINRRNGWGVYVHNLTRKILLHAKDKKYKREVKCYSAKVKLSWKVKGDFNKNFPAQNICVRNNYGSINSEYKL